MHRTFANNCATVGKDFVCVVRQIQNKFCFTKYIF